MMLQSFIVVAIIYIYILLYHCENSHQYHVIMVNTIKTIMYYLIPVQQWDKETSLVLISTEQ